MDGNDQSSGLIVLTSIFVKEYKILKSGLFDWYRILIGFEWCFGKK